MSWKNNTAEFDKYPGIGDFTGGLCDADELGEVADELIRQHDQFSHLRRDRIQYLWKLKGGTRDGQAILGKCRKVTGEARALNPGIDFQLVFSWDHWKVNGITFHQAEAIVFHELKHAGYNAEGKPVIIPHDWYGFSDEVTDYGVYSGMLMAAGASFRQLGLALD